jgi:hypothetical protein
MPQNQVASRQFDLHVDPAHGFASLKNGDEQIWPTQRSSVYKVYKGPDSGTTKMEISGQS